MAARRLLVATLLVSACAADPSPDARPIAVDPFIGSAGQGFAVGSAFVGAAAPHGLAKVGPDTTGPLGTLQFLHCAGYWHDDDTILGFSQMHLHGTGLPDYGQLSLMPLAGQAAAPVARHAVRSKFAKDDEVAEPGYYAVTVDNGGVRVELTATTRVALHRYTFPAGEAPAQVFVDLGARLVGGEVQEAEAVLDEARHEISGRVHASGALSNAFGGFDLYFVLRARDAWTRADLWSEAGPASGPAASGRDTGVLLAFPRGPRPVEIAVGLSLTSTAQARHNLDTEHPVFDFDGTRAAARLAWEERIGRIRTQGGSPRQQRVFLAALYHLWLMPTVVSDVDGSYRGMDGQVHVAEGYTPVSDLSLWDTYRTLHPLYGIIGRQENRDAVRSLVAMGKESGAFPKWPIGPGESGCMLGSSAEVVLADAYEKGIVDFDAEGAYRILRAAALAETDPPGGRGGRADAVVYMRNGYVSLPLYRSVSMTTEYSYDDFALARLARALGHDDDAALLDERARSYRRLYDPGTGFLRARRATGEMASELFDPLAFGPDYAEANAWQSLFYAPHDVDGLAALLGGREALVAKLETFFELAEADLGELDRRPDPGRAAIQRPYYWGGNEPDIQAPFMFSQAGRPDLTARWSRWATDRLYADTPAGLPGNDDGGTLSAWYLFASMGLYPLPGTDRYIVGAPTFERVELSVEGGSFTISAPGTSPERPYVQSARLDGWPLEVAELRHADLHPGGTLELEMGPAPSRWARSP